jgi:predicted dehydrogenase
MSNGKVRFAVIGAGHIGKRHAEMVKRNEDAELVAIADILPAEQLGVEVFGVPYFQSAEALFASGLEFDVVNICSPNGLHAAHSIMALENRKHIVCEKPMGLSKAECENVIFKASPLVLNKKITMPTIIFIIGFAIWFLICTVWVGGVLVFGDGE